MGHELDDKTINTLSWNLNLLADIELLVSSEVHWFAKEWDDVWVEGLPVWILEVVFLTLHW